MRCGNCSEVFNALNYLMDEIPPSVSQQSVATKADTVFNQDSEIDLQESAGQAFSRIEAPSESSVQTGPDTNATRLEGLVDDLSEVEDVPMSSLSKIADLSDLTDISEVSKPVVDKQDALNSKDSPQASSVDASQYSRPEALENEVDQSASRSQMSPAETHSPLSEINRDIDEALDGLFDETTLASHSGAQSTVNAGLDSSVYSKEEDDVLVDHSIEDNASSNDNEHAGLDLQSEDSELTEAVKRDDLPYLKDLELDLSDEPENFLSKSEERREKQQSRKTTEFELGDSLLSSDALSVDDSDWSPEARTDDKRSDMMSDGENFILDELHEIDELNKKGGISKILWILLIIVLVVVLMGQFIYLKRDDLVKYPAIVPILKAECQVIGLIMPCEVPERRALEKIEVVDRKIVSHPNVKNALLITTTLKNNADFAQPFPKMILTFSDINQKMVARRIFSPNEYLPKDVDINAGMPPGAPIKVKLEIVDPGEEAVNFRFDFK